MKRCGNGKLSKYHISLLEDGIGQFNIGHSNFQYLISGYEAQLIQITACETCLILDEHEHEPNFIMQTCITWAVAKR